MHLFGDILASASGKRVGEGRRGNGLRYCTCCERPPGGADRRCGLSW